MSVIYVLDTETTGLRGCPSDHVVDIGVAGLDTDTGKVWSVYSTIVGYEVSKWDICHKNAWIFNNTDLRLDDVAKARPQDDVRLSLSNILRDCDVTSFNTEFDFNKFLYNQPWNLRGIFHEMPDIMKAATPVCKVEVRGEYKYPKLEVAYEMLCPDDPAEIEGVQQHRALSDAVVASYVLFELIEKEAYAVGDSQ